MSEGGHGGQAACSPQEHRAGHIAGRGRKKLLSELQILAEHLQGADTGPKAANGQAAFGHVDREPQSGRAVCRDGEVGGGGA